MTLRKLMKDRYDLTSNFMTDFIKEYKEEMLKLGLIKESRKGIRNSYLVVEEEKIIEYFSSTAKMRNIFLKKKYITARNTILKHVDTSSYISKFIESEYQQLAEKNIIAYEKIGDRNFYYCLNEKMLMEEYNKFVEAFKMKSFTCYKRPYRYIADEFGLTIDSAQNLFNSISQELFDKKYVEKDNKSVNNLYKVVNEEGLKKLVEQSPTYINLKHSKKYRTIHSILNEELSIINSNISALINRFLPELQEKQLIKEVKVKTKTYYYSLDDKAVEAFFKPYANGIRRAHKIIQER